MSVRFPFTNNNLKLTSVEDTLPITTGCTLSMTLEVFFAVISNFALSLSVNDVGIVYSKAVGANEKEEGSLLDDPQHSSPS